jgi:cytochrome c553
MRGAMIQMACLVLACVTLPGARDAVRADPIEQKAALCAACHGGGGKPVNPSIPVLWGQNEGYIYLQLRDYKLANRKNPLMAAMVAGLDKPQMKALAAYFAGKDWPDLEQPRAPQDVARHAEAINDSAGCKGCHLDQWQGDSATPRLAGQAQSYLRETMSKFRSGERGNNPWMTALLKTYSDQDIDALAKYLAGL